jgi:HEAT repeat protein
MQRTTGWARMVAWVLVGLLLVGLWATPGGARQSKEEKPKPTEAQIAGLLAALEDEWPQVKRLVFEQLAEFDGAALRGTLKQPEVLAKKAFDILKDEKVDANVRGNAALALGNLGDAANPYVKDLVAVLKDEEIAVDVRVRAADALGNLGDAANPYVKDLVAVLKDEKITAPVRGNAAYALGNLGDAAKPYVKDLVAVLKDGKIAAYVRGNAADALGNLGDAANVKDLVAFLKDEKIAAYERRSAALALGSLGDAAKPYVKDIVAVLKDEKITADVRGSAAVALGNLGDAAKPYVKDIVAVLKDEKIAADVRRGAAVALGNLGDAAKPYVKDIAAVLKDEKITADVRGSAAVALGNLGDAAKPYMRDLVKFLGKVFLQLSGRGGGSHRALQILSSAILQLGGLTLPDALPVVNAIYGNTPMLYEGRFLVKTTTLGDKDTVTLLNWVGKPKTPPKKLTHDDAKNTLKIFQTAWDASADLPELRADLASQIREVANNRKIVWQADDIPLLTGLANSLKTGGYTSADLDTATQTIALYKYGLTLCQLILTHITFWIGLIFFYPKSPQIQAIFFWNPWVRNIAGLGYVSFLLTWIPFLRNRLLAPFRTSLLADANLLNQDPHTHYFATSQVRPRNSAALQPLPPFQGQLILEGESGLGKTMYLRHLVQTTRRTTVYLTAQRCEHGVLEAIQDKLEGNAKDPAFLQNLIYSRALDICIDGLNEVSPDTRAKITQFLERNFQGNFILTTQPLNGWIPPKTAKIYELQPLSPDQIRQFLHSRIDTLPATALLTGLDYTAACDEVLAH